MKGIFFGRLQLFGVVVDAFPDGSGLKNLPEMQVPRGDADLIPGLGRSPGERKGQPLAVFLPEKSHGRRSLAGCSPKGRKELDMMAYTYSTVSCDLGVFIRRGELMSFHSIILRL